MSQPHGVVERHPDHIVCVCGAVIYAAGRRQQDRRWMDHCDEERAR